MARLSAELELISWRRMLGELHAAVRYNDAWQCPLAPPGNTISTPVSTGERLPPNFGRVLTPLASGRR